MPKKRTLTNNARKCNTKNRRTRINNMKNINMKKGGSTTSNSTKSRIVKVFFEILNNIKLYHWKTKSYAQHKATDDIHSKLNDNIDKFVEVLLGKDSSRIQMVEKHIDIIDFKNTNDFKEKIFEFRAFLTDLNAIFKDKHDSDILSIRDDILTDINQFLYLMTFDK